MSDQASQLFTVPPKLKGRQAEVYAISAKAPLIALTAGLVIHERRGCRHCDWVNGAPCRYAETEGHRVLEALRRKGLLKRDRHHVYRRADSTPALADGGYDPATAPIPF